MSEHLRVIGQPIIRKDGIGKVTGKARYTADVAFSAEDKLEGLTFLVGKVVRSIHHHARILELQTEKAKQIQGVEAVLVSEDIPGEKLFGALVQDQPVLAIEKVLHIGQPVALIIAENEAAAAEAAEAIEVTYEVLDAVLDPVEAMKPGAEVVHESGNLVCDYVFFDGDVEAGFAQSDVVIEEIFFVPRIHPGYMEMENSTAYWEGDTLIVFVSSQHPFVEQSQIASVLGMSIDKVRVKSAVIGGAFGGKEDSGIAILAGLGALATKKPVRLVNNRKESFLSHPKRHPARLDMKIGATKEGHILSLQAKVTLNTGAFASYGPAVGGLLTEVIPSVYQIPNVKVETFVVYTHSPFGGAMRGFGSPQAHFATESLIDMMAKELGHESMTLREKNLLKPGDNVFTRVIIDNSAMALSECLSKANDAIRKLRNVKPRDGWVCGVGVAFATQTMGLGYLVPDDSTHRIEWKPDGSVTIYLGAPDLGQGLEVAAEQVVSEELGIPVDKVFATLVDTSAVPNGGVTCASRMTFLAGNALVEASARLKDSLLEASSLILNQPKEALRYQNGVIITEDGEGMQVEEFTSRAAELGIQLVSTATASFPYPDTTPTHLPPGFPHVKYCFGAQVVRVEVDPDLGVVEVRDVVAIHDVGKVINPIGVEGQIEGGVLTGIGYALYEDMKIKGDGEWVDSFTEYLLPTIKEMPDFLESVILEVPDESGPYGAKGIGEITLVPTAPAIANAVYDAVGVRVNKIPIEPEDLIK